MYVLALVSCVHEAAIVCRIGPRVGRLIWVEAVRCAGLCLGLGRAGRGRAGRGISAFEIRERVGCLSVVVLGGLESRVWRLKMQ